MIKRVTITILSYLWAYLIVAQIDSPGAVTLEDFEVKVPGESAVYLINDGHIDIKVFDKGGYYRATTKKLMRIKVLSKDALELGNIKILRFVNGNAPRKEERIRDIKAATYNLNENTGQIEVNLLDQTQIKRTKVRSKVEEVSFALPNVKVNSILQISYVVDSPFLTRLENWHFQKDHPVKKSTFSITNASTIRYVYTLQGLEHLKSFERNEGKKLEALGRVRQFDTDWWSVTNIPAYRKEPFTSIRQDYIAKLEIQMKSTGNKDYIRAWEFVGHDLQQNKRFKNFFSGKINISTWGISKDQGSLSRAMDIFEKFKSTYRWDGNYGVFPNSNLKQLDVSKAGNEPALGLGLYHILYQDGYDVDPVMVSPKFNGKLNYFYPYLDMFIATVVRLRIQDKVYLLDPVHDMPFGYLNKDFLNGKGLVLSEKVKWQDLNLNDTAYKFGTADIVVSKQTIHVKLSLTLKDYDLLADNTPIENHLKTEFWEVVNSTFNQDEPGVQKWQIYLKTEIEDDLISIPLIFENLIFQKNPFKDEQRLFPIDFDFKNQYSYDYKIQLSDEYEFESIPEKHTISTTNDNMLASLNVEEMDKQLKLKFYYETKVNSFPNSDYSKIKAAYDLMADLTYDEIFIKRIEDSVEK